MSDSSIKVFAGSNPRLLDLKTAAAYSGLSYWRIYALVKSGHLPHVQLPCGKGAGVVRRIFIDKADLDALIDDCKRSGVS